MPDPEVPQFQVSNEGDPFPPVDPEDVKRAWKIKPGYKEAWIAELARGLDNSAISKRLLDACQCPRQSTIVPDPLSGRIGKSFLCDNWEAGSLLPET